MYVAAVGGQSTAGLTPHIRSPFHSPLSNFVRWVQLESDENLEICLHHENLLNCIQLNGMLES